MFLSDVFQLDENDLGAVEAYRASGNRRMSKIRLRQEAEHKSTWLLVGRGSLTFGRVE